MKENLSFAAIRQTKKKFRTIFLECIVESRGNNNCSIEHYNQKKKNEADFCRRWLIHLFHFCVGIGIQCCCCWFILFLFTGARISMPSCLYLLYFRIKCVQSLLSLLLLVSYLVYSSKMLNVELVKYLNAISQVYHAHFNTHTHISQSELQCE